MLYSIPLNKSHIPYNPKINLPKEKPFGIDNSSLLLNSSFINNNLKTNLPFADTKLDPLQESEFKFDNKNNNYDADSEVTSESEENSNSDITSGQSNKDLLISKYEDCE